MLFNIIYHHYKSKFYDRLVLDFIGEVPDVVSEPVMDFLADKRVLFEKFLSIQAYHIQRARIQNNKSQDFYDGSLVIIKAFLYAVSKRVEHRTTVVPGIDEQKQTKDSLDKISEFLRMGTKKE